MPRSRVLIPAVERVQDMDIYTDGACVPNPGSGSWAYVILEKDTLIYTASGFEIETTCNRMEFTALIQALEFINGKGLTNQVKCYSDSQLLVNTCNSWLDKWRIKKRLHKRCNVDLLHRLINLKKLLEFELVWVKGHSGNRWNEFCDALCSDEIKKREVK